MQVSNAPTKSPVPFANSGTKNTIPVDSQIGITPGLASFTDGFPPLTMTPLTAGGVPPYGADFNGILNFLSEATRWGQAGAGYPYDAAFSAAIGGYPKGAQLKQASGNGYWLSLADNNTSNPDSGGANWIAVPAGIASAAQAQALNDDTVALTPKKLADAFGGANSTLAATGFQRLPNGLIEQWCSRTHTAGANGNQTLSFPFAFPNEAFVADFQENSQISAGAVVWSVSGLTASGVTAFWNYSSVTGGTPTRAAYVRAIGR